MAQTHRHCKVRHCESVNSLLKWQRPQQNNEWVRKDNGNWLISAPQVVLLNSWWTPQELLTGFVLQTLLWTGSSPSSCPEEPALSSGHRGEGQSLPWCCLKPRCPRLLGHLGTPKGEEQRGSFHPKSESMSSQRVSLPSLSPSRGTWLLWVVHSSGSCWECRNPEPWDPRGACSGSGCSWPLLAACICVCEQLQTQTPTTGGLK